MSKPWPLEDLIMAARIVGFAYFPLLLIAVLVSPWLPLGIITSIVLFFLGVRWATQGKLRDGGNAVMAGGALSTVIGPFFWPAFLGVLAIPIGLKIRVGGSAPKPRWRSYDPSKPQLPWFASPLFVSILAATSLGQAAIRFWGTSPTGGIVPLALGLILIAGQIAERNAPPREPGQQRTSVTRLQLHSFVFEGLVLLAGFVWLLIVSLPASGSSRQGGFLGALLLLLLSSLNFHAWSVARKLPRSD